MTGRHAQQPAPEPQPTPARRPSRFAQDLTALRSNILLAPAAAARFLNRHLQAGIWWTEPEDRADAVLLLAEALLRARDLEAAADTAKRAVSEAAGALPDDWRRQRRAYAVAVDAHHHDAARPDATGCCRDYLRAVADTTDPDTEPWTVLARALTAVAVFHERSCSHGRHLLTDLQTSLAQHGQTGALIDVVSTGLREMNAACFQPGHRAAPEAPPPTPGGILAPDVTEPHPRWLANRVTVRPGRHDCSGPARR